MASANLRKFAGTIFSEYYSTQRQLSALLSKRRLSSKSSSVDGEPKLEVPLKYTGSEAHAWKAGYSRSGNLDDERLWYEQYVILGSLSIFMIYFFILREENDVDQKFDKTLYDHIEGLEERQIERAIEFNLQNGIDTKELEARLKEIRGQ